MTAANLNGPEPGYQILFAEIYEKIRTGQWGPDTRLPSEREFCELYGVSRTMVRQALQQAERHGLLVRAPGRGTFVARPRVRQELGHMQSFGSTLASHALEPGHRILACGWEPAGDELANRLELPPGATVLMVESLGLGDGRPMALYHAHIREPAASRVEAALREPDLTSKTTYELAAEALRLPSLVAEQTFEVTAVEAGAAVLLQVPVGSAAFHVTTLFRSPDARPLEYRTATYPGDRYAFHITRELRVRVGS